MNRLKKILTGLFIGIIGVTNIFASNGIKNVEYTDVTIKINEVDLRLENYLLSVEFEESNNAKTYMPLREILEELGYSVEYNGNERYININENVDNSEVEIRLIDKYIDLESNSIGLVVYNNTNASMIECSVPKLEAHIDDKWQEMVSSAYDIPEQEPRIVANDLYLKSITLKNYKKRETGKYKLTMEYMLESGKIITKEIKFYIKPISKTY